MIIQQKTIFSCLPHVSTILQKGNIALPKFKRNDLDSIQWYEIANNATIALDDGSFDIIDEGTEFYVTKLRCNTVEDRSGNKYAQIQKAYITTDDGKSGWLNVSFESRNQNTVTNPMSYGM